MARIDLHQAIVSLQSVAPSCNFHNESTTQYKIIMSAVGGAIHFPTAEYGSMYKKFHSLFITMKILYLISLLYAEYILGFRITKNSVHDFIFSRLTCTVPPTFLIEDPHNFILLPGP